LIKKLLQAAASPGPHAVDSVFGATTLADYGKLYNLRGWEKGQMRSCLERILTRACKLVTDAFPVEENAQRVFGYEYVSCTIKRANFDSHKDDWLTYLTVPHLDQVDPYDRDETAEPASTSSIIPGISTADVTLNRVVAEAHRRVW
jgi:hypothetical protein